MKNLILTIVAVFTIISVSAQEKKKEEVKKKAKDKTEKRVDDKIDNAIDESLDAVENLFKFGKKKKKKGSDNQKSVSETDSVTTENSQNAMNMLSSMFGGSNVEIEGAYNFDSDMLIELTTTENKKKKTDSYSIKYYLSDNNRFAYEMENFEGYDGAVKMIMDWDKKSMLMFMEEQKQIMVMPLNTDKIDEMVNKETEKAQNGSSDIQNFKKTGNTKKILGYTCEEYTFENDDTQGAMWVTKEVEVDLSKMMGGIGSASKGKQPHTMPKNYPQGTLMEGTWTEKKSGDVTKWEMKELNANSKTSISTNGYQVMNFGNMMNQGGKN